MKTKKILSMLLTPVMALSLGAVTVFAEGGTGEATTYDLSQAELTKDFKVADGVDISSFNSFKFSFTAGSSDTAATGDHPDITEQTVTVDEQSGDHAYGSLTLDQVFDIEYFSHAGEYVYTVAEVNGGKEGITYDTNSYTVRLYVINGTVGLEFSGVTVQKGEDKVDPTIEDGKNTSGFNFVNTYKEDLGDDDYAALTVTKKVTGAYGDKTKTFPITVTLTLPSTATKDDVAVAAGAEWDSDTLTAKADLSDSKSIVFTKLPAGTTFKVEETQDSLYDGKIEGDLIETATFTTGTNVTANSDPIVAAGKTVTLTNNRENVIPTGIIINNLPYILLVVIAGVGVTFIVLKKKKANA